MTEVQIGSYTASLAMLFNAGVRFGTVIDLGCADGSFCLNHFSYGLFPGATCVNVDANTLYEPSLREIRQALGGHYIIAAVSDQDGETELNAGSHPYWASAVPLDHSYWAGPLNPPGQVVKVRALTLDTLVRELALKPPFLVKLDLQCGELTALRGAERMLAETDVIVCETAIDEFPSISEFLSRRDLELFDLTDFGRYPNGTLYQFYPVFRHRRLDHIMKAKDPYADPAQRTVLLARMKERREALLKDNAAILARLRATAPR
jgi:FkbM family methyltransferase